jgi:histidinol-phosphatase
MMRSGCVVLSKRRLTVGQLDYRCGGSAGIVTLRDDSPASRYPEMSFRCTWQQPFSTSDSCGVKLGNTHIAYHTGHSMQASEHLSVALEAARSAAVVIMKYYQQPVEIQTKSDLSPVTIADIESEKVIRRIITRAFPDHGFYGEETGQQGIDAEFLWLVDPIDGTKSFVREYPFFSTQIALMKRGELVLGVSSAPAFDELAWAEVGSGAYLNGKALKVSEVRKIGECTLSTGNLKTLARGRGWEGLGRLVAQVSRNRGYGDFYHYHLLASGKIDVVLESDVNILDVAAIAVIVREAGGIFTDLQGNSLDLNTSSVLAANAHLHDLVLRSL